MRRKREDNFRHYSNGFRKEGQPCLTQLHTRQEIKNLSHVFHFVSNQHKILPNLFEARIVDARLDIVQYVIESVGLKVRGIGIVNKIETELLIFPPRNNARLHHLPW